MRNLIELESLESRQHLADFTAAVNFQPLNASKAPRMAIDYGVRRGGVRFGWTEDRSAQAVDRNLAARQCNDTFIRMNGASWEIQVPHGDYEVYIVAGDPARTGDRVGIEVEGSVAIAAITKPRRAYLEGWADVHVSDGKLTIKSLSSTDLINYVSIIGMYITDEGPGLQPQGYSATYQSANASFGTSRIDTVTFDVLSAQEPLSLVDATGRAD